MWKTIKEFIASVLLTLVGVLATILIVPGIFMVVVGAGVIIVGATFSMFVIDGEWKASVRTVENILKNVF